MFTREEQFNYNSIILKDEFDQIRNNLNDEEKKEKIWVDSPLGIQYFKLLSLEQKKSNKEKINLVIQGGVYSSGKEEPRDI
jgi:hypothetical protein